MLTGMKVKSMEVKLIEKLMAPIFIIISIMSTIMILSLSELPSLNSLTCVYGATNTDTDTKSGLKAYYDSNLEKWGYSDTNGNIVLPAKWYRADQFFAGYALVVEDKDTVTTTRDNNMLYANYLCRYDIINEKAEVVGSFNYTTIEKYGEWRFGPASSNIEIARFVENSHGLLGYVWGPNADAGWLYGLFSINGQIEWKEYPDFKQTTENNILTQYHLGTFYNGSANVYKYTRKKYLDIGEYLTYNLTPIGSITTNGEFSTAINPKSNYIKDSWYGESIPKYGTKQFAEEATTVSESWKQDKNGWWYQNSDGTYPISEWKEINGKQYYFGSDGYMLSNTTTPDGYKVGADGAWIQ